MVGETLIAGVGTLPDRGNLVEENASPDVSILHVVEPVVAAAHELVNFPRVTRFVVLSPVSGELELGLFRRAVLAEACEVNYERHVATVPAEESQALEVSLHERPAPDYSHTKGDQLQSINEWNAYGERVLGRAACNLRW